MNYYNDNNRFSAEWINKLISMGLVPSGKVDGRSIKQIEAGDIAGFTQCHFFAGVAGWSLALALAGWPADVAVWTGSCPCQPFSQAGKRGGTNDERHLWPDFHRLIADCRPPIVFGEQVASADGRQWLAGVRTDLEALGYAVGAADLCAAGVSAPNGRQRLWWVADAYSHEFRGNESAGQQSLHEQNDGTTIGLAHAGSKRRRKGGRGSRGARGQGLHGQELGADGQLGGMADAASLRSPQHEHNPRERQGSQEIDAADGNGAGGVGHAVSQRQSQRAVKQDGRGTARNEGAAVVAPGAAWLRARIVQCRDGRARRFGAESGDEPLAYGIPVNMGRGRTRRERLAIRAARANRVGRIAGYGNAINPWVAAEFIAAYLETRTG